MLKIFYYIYRQKKIWKIQNQCDISCLQKFAEHKRNKMAIPTFLILFSLQLNSWNSPLLYVIAWRKYYPQFHFLLLMPSINHNNDIWIQQAKWLNDPSCHISFSSTKYRNLFDDRPVYSIHIIHTNIVCRPCLLPCFVLLSVPQSSLFVFCESK